MNKQALKHLTGFLKKAGERQNPIKTAMLVALGCGLFCSLFLSLTYPARAQTTGCVAGKWTEVPGTPRGLTSGTGPTAVVFNNNLHLFVTGLSDRIYTNVFQSGSGTWSGWSQVPGGAAAAGTGPAATVYKSKLHLFTLGFNGSTMGGIFVNVLSSSGWSGWGEVPGGGAGSHGLAATRFQISQGGQLIDELNLFVRGGDGAIYTNILRGASWSGWGEVPGGGFTPHGPGATVAGNLFLYVRGNGGGIFENVRDFTTGSWSGWSEKSGEGTTTAAPGVAFGHPAGVLMVIRGHQGRIHQQLLDKEGWTEVPGNGRASATAGPSVVVYQGKFQTFVGGPNDRILCSSR
jgi:hypothetical protein